MKPEKLFIILLTLLSVQVKAQWKLVYDSSKYKYGTVPAPKVFSDGENIILRNDYGIALTKDSGKSWKQVNTSLPVHSLQFVLRKDSLLFASIATYGIYYSADNGMNWKACPNWPSKNITGGITVSGNTILAAVDKDEIILSDDNGQTWRSSNQGLPSTLRNPGGWPPDYRSFYGFGTFENSVLCFLSNDAGMDQYISFDHGRTWQFRTDSCPIAGNIITLGTTLVASDFISKDSGLSWQQTFFEQSPMNYPSKACTNGKYVAVAVKNEGVIFSKDSGLHWYFINDGLTSMDLGNVAMTSHYLYCGANYGKVFRRPLSEAVGIKKEDGHGNSELSNLRIYPNPLQHSATVEFGRELNNGRFCLYDMNGKQVRELAQLYSDRITLERAGLAEGTYLYLIIEKNNKLAWGKLVIE